MIKVAPSMLAADYMHLDSEIDKVVASGADVLHYDVMDGTFVPGITFGQGILKMVAKKPIPMDVHLMIANPIKHVREFAEAGAKYITVHQEAANFELRDTLRAIREAGVALVPGTCFGAEAFVRLSYCVSDDDLETGLDRLEKFVTALRG